MNRGVSEKLLSLADEAVEIGAESYVEQWSARARAFLSAAIGVDAANLFSSLYSANWLETLAMRRGHLEGLAATLEAPGQAEEQITHVKPEPNETSQKANSRKVFIVHGRDDAAKESAARFMEKVGLQPIILHEQPNAGRTIIEKFETYSDDVAFAVVLLTPDDLGSEAGDPSQLKPRARQNVIMELGYFIGRLGRTRVCALHKGNVERPSDYQGVLYIEMDAAGAWKAKLAQELVQSRISIDLAGLLSG